MYEGSDAAWKPNRCAPIAMIAVAALATRDGSMEGRVSNTYAAFCCSAAGEWFAMKARIFASVSGQTRRPPRMSRTKCGSFIASLPNVIGDMPCNETNSSMASSSEGASFCIFSNVQ